MLLCTVCTTRERISRYKTSFCRECKREYDRKYHKSRSSIRKQDKQDKQKIRMFSLRKFVFEYLLTHPCIDCGEKDILVLDFDHVRGIKVAAVSFLLTNGCSKQKLVAEIKKCDIRCANCHRRKTAEQFVLWKYRLLAVGEFGTPPDLESGELVSSNLTC